ncbi:uncharacterized protein BDR25DRAFT_348071 [Lindgomyces ingoldianus]|uniref:Uncharacterized protein n=1 Tax=Lindgomyces ingoldianus TaxID=673940 RepID=A0ACB6REH8_9PLEO|nr:uncharacterized protein BDR25DRAFT_348071 [Lindgomyces ingoldianus]KAF2477754.1 hypothetical protein BDR25DRAFT_348071 [Lindgomyces ingoldianus]
MSVISVFVCLDNRNNIHLYRRRNIRGIVGGSLMRLGKVRLAQSHPPGTWRATGPGKKSTHRVSLHAHWTENRTVLGEKGVQSSMRSLYWTVTHGRNGKLTNYPACLNTLLSELWSLNLTYVAAGERRTNGDVSRKAYFIQKTCYFYHRTPLWIWVHFMMGKGDAPHQIGASGRGLNKWQTKSRPLTGFHELAGKYRSSSMRAENQDSRGYRHGEQYKGHQTVQERRDMTNIFFHSLPNQEPSSQESSNNPQTTAKRDDVHLIFNQSANPSISLKSSRPSQRTGAETASRVPPYKIHCFKHYRPLKRIPRRALSSQLPSAQGLGINKNPKRSEEVPEWKNANPQDIATSGGWVCLKMHPADPQESKANHVNQKIQAT